MYTLKKRNVNGLFAKGVQVLAQHGERQASRAGPVLVAPWPVMSVYERPCERVLMDPKRDANPFFHLFEGLWMLAGRRDAASLDRYVYDFGFRFGEPYVKGKSGQIIHDAYGYRWRHAMGFDQLHQIVQRLVTNPDDRQCVLQMWDCNGRDDWRDHGVYGPSDLTADVRSRPCNTHAYFRLRSEHKIRGGEPTYDSVLDMTVCCRSNDIIWGAYGANAVHFSMLLEYVAGRVGVQVGTMYQLSNNWHGYIDALDKLGDPDELSKTDPYEVGSVCTTPMGTDWSRWDEDLQKFMAWHNGGARNPHGLEKEFVNTWFKDVAVPMCRANAARVDGNLVTAQDILATMPACDWKVAGLAWITRRLQRMAAGIGDVR